MYGLRPIDPATAEDLPGYEPIDLKQAAHTLLSPDGRTLAVSITPGAAALENSESTLHLLDLESWSLTPVEGVPRGLRPVAWSDADSRFYALGKSCLDPGNCFHHLRRQL